MGAETMAANQELSARCSAVRAELKAWEKQFAAVNGGRKAGRGDIKANADIALKYKEYNRLRDLLHGKTKAPTSPKRKADAPVPAAETPTKKTKVGLSITTATPTRRDAEKPSVQEQLLSASKLYTPSRAQVMIGPTPQKNGIVLGLFDLLPAESPSKTRTVLGDIQPNTLLTPRKTTGKTDEELLQSGRLFSRTPVSEGKRNFLNQFATPMKRKRVDEQDTPSSRGQETPMFLRRDCRPLESVTEDTSLSPRPRKPRSFMRSLSSILQERKKEREEDQKKEEEAKRQESQKHDDPNFDDEEEALRELEAESEGLPAPKKKVIDVLVEDSQVVMKLGADGENLSESEASEEENDGLDANGQPRKVWKKRGQKRQTKRVIMRPVRTRRPQPRLEPIISEDEGKDEDVVLETQTHAAIRLNQNDDDDDTATDVDSDYSNASHTSKKRRTQSSSSLDAEPVKEKESLVKKAARKISATAHANFRKLKIKNKNSKANGRSWGRGRR